MSDTLDTLRRHDDTSVIRVRSLDSTRKHGPTHASGCALRSSPLAGRTSFALKFLDVVFPILNLVLEVRNNLPCLS